MLLMLRVWVKFWRYFECVERARLLRERPLNRSNKTLKFFSNFEYFTEAGEKSVLIVKFTFVKFSIKFCKESSFIYYTIIYSTVPQIISVFRDTLFWDLNSISKFYFLECIAKAHKRCFEARCFETPSNILTCWIRESLAIRGCNPNHSEKLCFMYHCKYHWIFCISEIFCAMLINLDIHL